MVLSSVKLNKEPPVDNSILVEPAQDVVCDMDRIVAQYGKYLMRMAFVMLKDRYLAEDAVQESMLKIYKHYKMFEDEEYEKNWILRITVNTCKDMLRRSWYSRVDSEAELEKLPAPHESKFPDDTPLREVMKLPHKYKEVILLFYYQDRQIKDIATILDVPENTVSTRLKRARAMLEEQLKGWYFDED